MIARREIARGTGRARLCRAAGSGGRCGVRLDRVSPYRSICIRADYEQMAALEFRVGSPMPVKQLRENLRLHLALLELFVAPLILRVVLRIRINGRHEEDVFAVR